MARVAGIIRNVQGAFHCGFKFRFQLGRESRASTHKLADHPGIFKTPSIPPLKFELSENRAPILPLRTILPSTRPTQGMKGKFGGKESILKLNEFGEQPRVQTFQSLSSKTAEVGQDPGPISIFEQVDGGFGQSDSRMVNNEAEKVNILVAKRAPKDKQRLNLIPSSGYVPASSAINGAPPKRAPPITIHDSKSPHSYPIQSPSLSFSNSFPLPSEQPFVDMPDNWNKQDLGQAMDLDLPISKRKVSSITDLATEDNQKVALLEATLYYPYYMQRFNTAHLHHFINLDHRDATYRRGAATNPSHRRLTLLSLVFNQMDFSSESSILTFLPPLYYVLDNNFLRCIAMLDD
ncbi:hypothetical protein BYT27DRAFT_7259143 [Phlegmacium glaucopus]|nr:hypothetical protein BYT27DRAFT_7259143 [Phlegmacium glaucopus]